jgi:putative transposase
MRQMGRSERRACELASLNRRAYRYRSTRRSDEPMRARLKELARRHLSYGTPRLTALLRREFGVVNHKRVERIYREEALQLPRRRKARRRGPAPRQPLAAPTRPGERWSMDFMSDSLAHGRRYRLLCIMDDFSRECVAIEVDTSLGGERVARVLDRLADRGRLPETIVVDNGPEFTSKALLAWAERQGVLLHFIEPGRPMQNAFTESFNGKLRTECLNQHWFLGLSEARKSIEVWRQNYNRERPHSALGYVVPHTYLQMWAQLPTSKLTCSPKTDHALTIGGTNSGV